MFSLVLPLSFVAFTQSISAMTLQEAFANAKKHRPTYKTKIIDVEIAQKEKSKAYARLAPRLSLKKTDDWNDSVGGSFTTDTHQSSSRLNLSQSLFQGGGEYDALNISKNTLRAAQISVRQAELELYAEVAKSYYNLMSIDQDILNLQEQKKQLHKRVISLRQRAKIGRSKSSEVIAAQSQMARVTAEVIKARSDRQLIVNHFKWLTGLRKIGPMSESFRLDSINVETLNEDRVLERPAIRVKEFALQNSKEFVGVARSEFWPSLGLSGNYYLDRSGTLQASDWDIALTASWELFNGGSSVNEVSIKKMQLRQTQLELEDLKARAVNSFRAQKERLKLQKRTLTAMARAVELAARSKRQQQKEFHKGLISSLELLRSIDDYLVVKRMYDRERFTTYQAWVELNTMVGQLP